MAAPHGTNKGMSGFPDILIYCNYEQPGGVERVSLRLRDFLDRMGHDAELISAFGDPVFGEPSEALATTNLSGRVVVFSRKGDLREMGRDARGARLVYWRHVPVTARGWRRLVDLAFMAWISRKAEIVCVCDELASEIVELPFMRKDAVVTCYSPVGANLPEAVDIRAPGDGPFRLVYFARHGDQKRLDLVLWQVADACADGRDVRLDIYGFEEPPEVDGVSMDGVAFCGRTDAPLERLAEADAVILVSDYEGFPTVMVEAALTGTPIICNDFRTGRVDFETLIGPVNLIDPEAPGALGEAIDSLASGSYALDALSDAQLARDWLDVLLAHHVADEDDDG